ncbi:MAG: hypothetical protein UZ21_OP11001000710 [Microgenomates bacterium OLB22]|nr:MAG: hypothetical protein UZ21_OP11001000710 [Microgenomates bacterium OLB22]
MIILFVLFIRWLSSPSILTGKDLIKTITPGSSLQIEGTNITLEAGGCGLFALFSPSHQPVVGVPEQIKDRLGLQDSCALYSSARSENFPAGKWSVEGASAEYHFVSPQDMELSVVTPWPLIIFFGVVSFILCGVSILLGFALEDEVLRLPS